MLVKLGPITFDPSEIRATVPCHHGGLKVVLNCGFPVYLHRPKAKAFLRYLAGGPIVRRDIPGLGVVLDLAAKGDEGPDTPESDESDPAFTVPERFADRLAFDADVSATSPCVRGTWVTVEHVIGLIVDGWAWSDILRTHPELDEDGIRACLAYTVAEVEPISFGNPRP